MEETRNAYNILVEKPEGKRALERSMCIWEDNIRMVKGKVKVNLPLRFN
jgi:hypothetical protein